VPGLDSAAAYRYRTNGSCAAFPPLHTSHVQGKSNESERLLLLDGLSYSFQKGERPVIVGRNGAGKTSFLWLLVDQQPLTDGNTIVR